MSLSRPEILRKSAALRRLVRETQLRTDDLVLPLFLSSESRGAKEISSLPGVHQWSVEASMEFVEKQIQKGIRSFMLFGLVPQGEKKSDGSPAWDLKGPVPEALRRYRKTFGDVNLFADTCFCEYTDHGHCGPLKPAAGATVLRDAEPTLRGLGLMAQAYAEAGANVIAPSGMVDGMVRTIRTALDQSHFGDVAICSYAVKYASQFYGPFREAAQNAPTHGDRRTYQMDIANRREALREIDLDLQEGADMILVKPALPCLDIVREAHDRTSVPVGAYHVSGEYAMVKAAAQRGWLDEVGVFSESLISMKRAGAQFIVTYCAPEAAQWIGEGRL